MLSLFNFMLVGILFTTIFGLFSAAQTDTISFRLIPAHSQDRLYSNFDGFVTCQRTQCPRTDILSIKVENIDSETSDTKPRFVEIDTYLLDGSPFSEARLNKTLAINQPSNLPMKILRPLAQGETVFFSGEIEWHRVSLSTTTTVTFGYGPSATELVTMTLPQVFYTPVDLDDDNFAPLKFFETVAPFTFDFTLYPQSPPFLSSYIQLFPYGGINTTPQSLCTVNSYAMAITTVYDDADTFKKFPILTLKIPTNHEQLYQSFQANTMVQITCTGFTQPNDKIRHGVSTLFFPLNTNDETHPATIQTSNSNSFDKLPRQQAPAMVIVDGTVSLSIPDYYSYTIGRLDSQGNQKTYSYHTLHVQLTSPEFSSLSSKLFHLHLDGIHGGAFATSRWALTARDSVGELLPYTISDKLSVDWSIDGKLARMVPFTVRLTDEMKARYDPSKGLVLTISFILSFNAQTRLPPILTPTVVIGVEQDIHWINFKSSKKVTFWELSTPVLSRKAIVISDNFHFYAFGYSLPEGSPEVPVWDNKNAIDFVGQERLFGFNASFANVQYLDFERPSYFSLAIPSREYNFGGDFSSCTINGNEVKTLNPLDLTKVDPYLNSQSVTFDYTLQPSVNYDLLCPHAFLTNSSRDSSVYHKNKEIVIEFVTESSTPEINEYTLIATAVVDFGNDHHDSGTVFAIITCAVLVALFVGILAFIIVDRNFLSKKSKAENGEQNHVELTDLADTSINSQNSPDRTQYQQFSNKQ